MCQALCAVCSPTTPGADLRGETGYSSPPGHQTPRLSTANYLEKATGLIKDQVGNKHRFDYKICATDHYVQKRV